MDRPNVRTGGVSVPPIQPGSTELELPRRRVVSRPGGRIVRRPGTQPNWKKRAKIALIVAGVLALLVGGWMAWKVLSNLAKSTKGNLAGLLSDTKLKGEDVGRVNILLAGDSTDDPGHGGSNLTDSIMILSIDTQQNTAFMLSVPRDLWTKVPGYGHQKINAANADGGMDLLEKVIEQDFGIDINYQALVNYTAFKQAVDAVGGIDVTIASSDKRGIYDPNISRDQHGPLILKNGLQHLDGQTALNLARARNDPTPDGRYGYGLPRGDFDRAANQRLMLTALSKKILSSGTLANPLKISQLLDALGNNVRTDFKTDELRRLYELGKKIDSSKIQSLSLTDKNLVADYQTSDGQSAQAPAAGADDFGDIQQYMKQLMSHDPVVKEGAQVVVLNASGVSGLAKREGDALKAKGIDVANVGNATGDYETTVVVDNSNGKMTATLQYLKGRYGSSTVAADAAATRAYPEADFIVILGADRHTSTSSGSDSSQYSSGQ